MARDVAGVVTGMEVLEPGFQVADKPSGPVGRFRLGGTDPAIEAAVDAALAAAELDVVPVELPAWEAATLAAGVLIVVEAAELDGHLLATEGVGADVRFLLELAASFTPEQVQEARTAVDNWKQELAAVFGRVEVIAAPTLKLFPPKIDGGDTVELAALTMPVNLAGVPALAQPIPADGPTPASLQLIGPENSEDRLLALGRVVEAAVT
jgi:amidase